MDRLTDSPTTRSLLPAHHKHIFLPKLIFFINFLTAVLSEKWISRIYIVYLLQMSALLTEIQVFKFFPHLSLSHLTDLHPFFYEITTKTNISLLLSKLITKSKCILSKCSKNYSYFYLLNGHFNFLTKTTLIQQFLYA